MKKDPLMEKVHRPRCVPACWQTGFHQRGIKKYKADVLRLCACVVGENTEQRQAKRINELMKQVIIVQDQQGQKNRR